MATSAIANPEELTTVQDETVIEEFHDAATVHTGENLTLTGAEWKEMHLMIEITYKNTTEGRTSPQKHMLILKELGSAFDKTELEIFDNKNRTLSLDACKEMKNIEHYEAHFKIHQGNGRHYVVFRVLTTLRFQSLKREGEVLKTLKKTGCYMKRHHWGQDKWDIVTLGFMLHRDPGRHMTDEVREEIIALASAKGAQTTPGTRFKLVAQRFKIRHNNTSCNADAYGVQCLRIDALAVDTLLKEVHRETKTYVNNKLRKESPKAFMNALRLQNKYITTVKTVILAGITQKTMTKLRPLLLAEPKIQYVAATRKLETIGRWDILTSETNQAYVIQKIEENLETWLQNIPDDPDRPIDFPDPGITQKTGYNNNNDNSSQGDMSYLSSSAGSYDSIMDKDESVEYNEAPQQRTRNAVSVSGFSWAQVTARTTTHTSQGNQSNGHRSNVSEITTPTTVQATPDPEIKELRDEVKSLTEKLNDLLALLQPTQSQPNANPPMTQPGHAHQPQIQPGFMPNQGQGGYLSQQQLYEQQQYLQAHWQGQGMAMAQQQQQQHMTPTRQNTQKRAGDDSTKPAAKFPPIEEDNEPEAKRKDKKDTPTKTIQPSPVNSPPQMQHPRITNPYNQERHLQFRHEGTTPHYNPWNFVKNAYNMPPGPVDHSALLYSQQYPAFQYTPPSQEMHYGPHYGPPQDTPMLEITAQSRSAEDAQNYAQL